jgi:hypothetical protein
MNGGHNLRKGIFSNITKNCQVNAVLEIFTLCSENSVIHPISPVICGWNSRGKLLMIVLKIIL